MDFEHLAVIAETDSAAANDLYKQLWSELRVHWDVDVCQSTVLVVHSKLGEFSSRGPGSFLRWVRGIARREEASSLARRSREQQLRHVLSHIQETPATNLSSKIERRQRVVLIEEELPRLIPVQRRAIASELAGTDLVEFAAEERVSVPAAGKVRSRARAELRRRLRERMVAMRMVAMRALRLGSSCAHEIDREPSTPSPIL